MNIALDQFLANIGRAKHFSALSAVLQKIIGNAVDLSDLYRAELVLGVSALDHLVHELVRIGMLECYRGARPHTTQFLAFSLTFSVTINSIANPGSSIFVEDAVREKLGRRTLQKPEDIAEALRLISDVELWNEVGVRMALPAADVKSTLKSIVDRRNKIAHEADIDPTLRTARWPISHQVADDAVDFLERVGKAISALV